MTRALLIAVKDLRVLFGDKSNIFWVFGFPIMFALFFGAVFSSSGKGPTGMNIAVVDEDRSEFSQLFVSRLASYDALNITNLDRDEAIEQVRKGKKAAAVFLNKGFGDGFEAMFDTNEPKLQLAADPSRRMESGYLQGLLIQAQFEAMGEKFTDRQWLDGQIDDWRGSVSDADDLNDHQKDTLLVFFDSFDEFLQDVNEQDLASGFDGDILNVAKLDIQRESTGPISPFQITFAQAVMWGILGCAATFAISIVKERTAGTFQRLRIAPIGRAHILGGKAVACFITCMSVILLLCLGAKFIFKMPIGNPFLLVLAFVCTVLCFVGLMMFICTLGRTEQSVGAAGWAMFMIMAMLGGGMMPLAFMPQWLSRLSRISPVRWGIYSMEGAVWRNFSFPEMIAPCAVLLAIGLVFFLLGVAMLRRTEL